MSRKNRWCVLPRAFPISRPLLLYLPAHTTTKEAPRVLSHAHIYVKITFRQKLRYCSRGYIRCCTWWPQQYICVFCQQYGRYPQQVKPINGYPLFALRQKSIGGRYVAASRTLPFRDKLCTTDCLVVVEDPRDLRSNCDRVAPSMKSPSVKQQHGERKLN